MSPHDLPAIPELRRITQSLAMLDAILCPEWEYRYSSYNAAWAPGEEMASLRNGSGDDWFLLFDAAGAALKGYDHERAHDGAFPAAIQEQVPTDFKSFLNEPAFNMGYASFCYWRRTGDAAWSKVTSALEDDGSDEMLIMLVDGPEGYVAWAEEYFEVQVELEDVQAIFAHQPLSDALILSLNPEADPAVVRKDAQEIGYPWA